MRKEGLRQELDGWTRAAARGSARDPASADDLYQEAQVVFIGVVRAYRGRNDYELAKIYREAVRNRFRDLARRAASTVRRHRLTARPEAGEGRHVQNVMDAMELRELCELLSPRQRNVLALMKRGLVLPEVALVTGFGKSSIYRDWQEIRETAKEGRSDEYF